MGLLAYLSENSLDEDYARVAARRDSSEKATKPRAGPTALVVLAAFGLLVAVAGVQTSRGAAATAADHAALVRQINTRQARLNAEQTRLSRLHSEVRQVQQRLSSATTAGRAVKTRAAALGTTVGSRAVTGPGVKVVVDDSPSGVQVQDRDLQLLVNALWQVGAEAVAINGQRVTSLTSIRTAGEAITVNYRYLNTPYVVRAIGNKSRMPASLLDTAGGQRFLALRSDYGVRFEIDTEDSMTLPPDHRVRLRDATSNPPTTGGSP
jgi:uncharacterized protein YlxW (UPF0749 family)